tara:strand:- start:581 stop:1177 length:597 start_codon:yes stop_codon:yes gene_type:complete
MASVNKSENKIIQNKKKHISNEIFLTSIICKRLVINFNQVDQNIKATLLKKLKFEIEGKCNIEGFIKNNSINIISYSCGVLKSDSIVFDVVFECLICYPVEGMIISCKVKDITKAGIRCLLPNDDKTLMIFIARDHHYNSYKFSQINVDDEIKVKVLGQRFELNDDFISVIAELYETKDLLDKSKTKGKPKLVLKSKE